MKQFLVLLIAMHFVLLCDAQTISYSLLPQKSKIEWIGKKVGGQHEGRIEVKSSTVQLNQGKVISGKLLMDMKSISVTDIESASSRESLREVLVADGFFETGNFPEASFEFSEVQNTAENKYLLKGNLKIKNKSKKIEVPVTCQLKGSVWTAQGALDINRIDFDVHYEGGLLSVLGDKAIKDIFTLNFTLSYTKTD